mgnify:CR=1 FL=1
MTTASNRKETHLKSLDRKVMPVRVRSPAPRDLYRSAEVRQRPVPPPFTLLDEMPCNGYRKNMKYVLFVMMLAGCGPKTECEEYAVVYCQKAGSCGYRTENDGVVTYSRVDQAKCRSEAAELIDALDVSEEDCTVSKYDVAKMSCERFWAFASSR